MPPLAHKCIESWRRFMPGYEIKRWDESNFDVNIIPYVSEAYNEGNYAFVSDYARVWIIYNYGGVYFDVDVEIISPISDIIEQGPFMGLDDSNPLKVCLGLGFGAIKGMKILDEILAKYENMRFIIEDGKHNAYGIVQLVTDIMNNCGLKNDNKIQFVDGITVYPWDYFCPLNYESGKITITPNTRTIHHFTALWMSPIDRKANEWRWKLKWLPYPFNAGIGRLIAILSVSPKNFLGEFKNWISAKR